MTPSQAAARINRIANALQRRCVTALSTSAKQGVIIARDLSKGPYSQAVLTAMGHPYARRHGMTRRRRIEVFGSTVGREYIINKQAGAFLANWHTGGPSSAFSGAMMAQVINDDKVAKYLKFGTRFMIQRPIGPTVASLLRPIANDNVRQAVRRAVRTK